MDIIERIKKLYNLSARNSSTAEAASAAAKMQKLAFDHELDLAAIIAGGTDAPRMPYIKFDYALPETSKADVGWKRTLFAGVCKGNFCKAVIVTGTTRLAVIGQKHNFEVVCYTYEFLCREIQRLAIENCIAQSFLDSKSKRKYIAGFCEGAMAEVYRKLTAAMAYRTQETTESRALVLVKNKELDDATRLHFPRLRKTSRRATGSSGGYSDGRRVGAGISVNRGVARNDRRQIT